MLPFMFSKWKLSFQVSSVSFTFIFACLLLHVLFFFQKLNQQTFFFVYTFPLFFRCTPTFSVVWLVNIALRVDHLDSDCVKKRKSHEVGE